MTLTTSLKLTSSDFSKIVIRLLQWLYSRIIVNNPQNDSNYMTLIMPVVTWNDCDNECDNDCDNECNIGLLKLSQ